MQRLMLRQIIHNRVRRVSIQSPPTYRTYGGFNVRAIFVEGFSLGTVASVVAGGIAYLSTGEPQFSYMLAACAAAAGGFLGYIRMR